MGNYGNSIKIIIFAFAGLILLNMAIMRVFFNTNVLNPVKSSYSQINIAEQNTGSDSSYDSWTEAGNTGVQDDTEVLGTYYPEDPVDLSSEEDNKSSGSVKEDRSNSYYMTKSEVGFLGNLDIKDKLKALSLISKVGRKDADKIYVEASDGVTYSEMNDIKDILGKYLTQKEMEILIDLLDKNKQLYTGADMPLR